MENEEIKELTSGITCVDNYRTYAKLHDVAAIHELPLRDNKGFGYCLRKS